MLEAIRTAVKDLKEYLTKNITSPSDPYYMHDNKLRHVKKLMCKERVFEANQGDRPVVIKFSRFYGHFASREELAPVLLSCETISGGWKAIMMEKMDGKALPPTLSNTIKLSLRRAVHTLHEAGFVHGDLRRQNILVTNEGVTRLGKRIIPVT